MKLLNGHGRDLRNEGFHTAPPWQCALSVSLPRLAAQIAKSTDHSVSIDTSLSLEGPCRTCPSGWVALAPHDRAARLYSCPIHGDHVAGSPADRQSYCRVTRTARHTVIVTVRNASAKAPVWSRFCLRRAVAVSIERLGTLNVECSLTLHAAGAVVTSEPANDPKLVETLPVGRSSAMS